MKVLKRMKGFTLVELIVTVAVVLVLAMVSVPIYKSYREKAKISEAYALLGAIKTAQINWYNQNSCFYYRWYNDEDNMTSFEPALGVDARSNNYFTLFNPALEGTGFNNGFVAHVKVPATIADAVRDGSSSGNDLYLGYNVTKPGYTLVWEGDLDSATAWAKGEE